MSRTRTGVPFCAFNTVAPTSSDRLHQAHDANVEGLLAPLNKASARVHVVRRQRLFHLGDVQAVVD